MVPSFGYTQKPEDLVKPLRSETRSCRVCLSSGRLRYMSNHNHNGTGVPFTPTCGLSLNQREKDQSSPGPPVSHCLTWPEASGLPAVVYYHLGVSTPAWTESRVAYTSGGRDKSHCKV